MDVPRSDRGLVAITGANGTIGYACVVYALQAGYRVRCIVRRPSAIETIRSGPSIQSYIHLLEFSIVPDNAIDGAYNNAIAGADYVVHIAGAWPLPHLHPDNDIYNPFINSTKNLVEAAKNSGTVRRIVVTQAGAGLVDAGDGDTLGRHMDRVMDEHVHVSPTSLAYRPPLPSPHHAYCAGKAQCMEYLANLQLSAKLPFSIVQVIPGTVIGPSEFCQASTEAFAHLDRQSKALLFDDVAPRYAFGFVHVQDCAKVHIEALDEAKAKIQDLPRWFVAAGTVQEGLSGEQLWNTAADMVEQTFPSQVKTGFFKIGRDKVPINMPFRAESRLTEKMLLQGESIRGLEESVREVAQWYISLTEKEI